MNIPPVIKELAGALEGKVDFISGPLSDGSGFATMSFLLPKDHWLYADHDNVPPMPFRVGVGEDERNGGMSRAEWANHIRAAGRYAIRACTMNGKEVDFDPDAMLQNFVVGLIGYWTPTGKSSFE